MTDPQPAPASEPQKEELTYLQQIAEHLRSIRSMLTFFVVMFILAVIIQACGALGF